MHDEWVDVANRSRTYRQLQRIVAAAGWAMRTEHLVDADAETIVVSLFGDDQQRGHVVLKATTTAGVKGEFTLTAARAGRYSARDVVDLDVLLDRIHRNPVVAEHARRAA